MWDKDGEITKNAAQRRIPETVLRSTFIVCFPGETEAEFEELLNFLEEAQLDRAGAVARSSADAPEIDGLVYIENGQQLSVGNWSRSRYRLRCA